MKREDNQQVKQSFSQQDIQILTEEDYEEEDPEQRHYFCALCKSRLDFLKETGTMWRCNECMEYYNTSIQDVPVKDLIESKVRTYTDYDTFRRNTEMKRYNNNSTTAVNQGWTYENTTNQ